MKEKKEEMNPSKLDEKILALLKFNDKNKITQSLLQINLEVIVFIYSRWFIYLFFCCCFYLFTSVTIYCLNIRFCSSSINKLKRYNFTLYLMHNTFAILITHHNKHFVIEFIQMMMIVRKNLLFLSYQCITIVLNKEIIKNI